MYVHKQGKYWQSVPKIFHMQIHYTLVAIMCYTIMLTKPSIIFQNTWQVEIAVLPQFIMIITHRRILGGPNGAALPPKCDFCPPWYKLTIPVIGKSLMKFLAVI